MKKLVSLFAVATVLVLAGAGCSSSTAPVDTTVKPVVQTNPATPSTPTTPTPVVVPTKTPPTPVTTPAATGPKTFTMAEVAAANTEANCLTVINGNVYNLTDWVFKHPGGDRNILRICGIDGSSAYTRQHGGQSRPEAILESYKVGVLK